MPGACQQGPPIRPTPRSPLRTRWVRSKKPAPDRPPGRRHGRRQVEPGHPQGEGTDGGQATPPPGRRQAHAPTNHAAGFLGDSRGGRDVSLPPSLPSPLPWSRILHSSGHLVCNGPKDIRTEKEVARAVEGRRARKIVLLLHVLLQDNNVTLLDHWLDHQVMHRMHIEGLSSFRRCNHCHRRVHGRRLIIEPFQRFCHLIEKSDTISIVV